MVFADPYGGRKKTLIHLQWLVVLATSYLVLFKKGEVVGDPWVFFLVLVLLATALALHRFSSSTFDGELFAPTLVVVDTVLISVAIGFNRESPWDLLLVFFFGLFIAATGESLLKIVAGCFLISILSLIVSPFSGVSLSQLDADILFRIPFLFGVSILYAYLAEQTKQEKKKAEKAEETERLKRQLVSALAHDIKNPFTVIMGYAERAASDLKEGRSADEILDALERIQDNAARVVKLVMGFLDASKAEAGKIEALERPVQLNLLLREVGQQQMAELRKRHISLSVDLDDHLPEIIGDEAQIDRVLWNLVSNAIKFTPRDGKVTLRSWVDDGKVCVSVSDTGIGIPKEEVPVLFKEFRRLKGAAKVDGTGLGLFIVKTVVEAHGGTVEAESEKGRGSTFTVRFPVQH